MGLRSQARHSDAEYIKYDQNHTELWSITGAHQPKHWHVVEVECRSRPGLIEEGVSLEDPDLYMPMVRVLPRYSTDVICLSLVYRFQVLGFSNPGNRNK